jgi:hypothetical protein
MVPITNRTEAVCVVVPSVAETVRGYTPGDVLPAVNTDIVDVGLTLLTVVGEKVAVAPAGRPDVTLRLTPPAYPPMLVKVVV